ncbi:MAG: glycosyltransferase family 39 protein [Planctomycetaceae bacterium]|jgi:hypothetical protein|nr:glycosyltransferase family 39 protein [Planctomycetaceae bacterium]
MPLTWDEGEISKRSDEIFTKWNGTINNEGHPQLPVILAAAGKILLPKKFFSKKFRLRFFSIFFISLSFTFLFSRLRREFNSTAAWLSILSILLIPRLFALLQIATWDSCLIASWNCCLAFFPTSLKSKRETAVFGFCLGLLFSSKFTGFTISIAFIVWTIFVWTPDKPPRKIDILKRLFIVTIISLLTFFVLNPPLWSNPLGGIFCFFSLNIFREIDIPIMFLGQIYDLRRPLPFYNTIFWTIITIPLGLLFFFLIGLFSILFRLIKRNENSSREIQELRFETLLIFNMLILLIIRATPFAPSHDGVRLFAGSYIFLGIISGLGASKIWRSCGGVDRGGCGGGIFVTKKILRRVFVVIIFAVSTFNVFWYAPQWLSFYNFAVGGLSGAVKIGMEATYYWDGFDRETIDWLNKNTNKNELILFAKFSPDTFEIYREDGVLIPEFYVYSDSDDEKNVDYKLNKAKRIRYYVTQNRAGLQSDVDLFFKRRSKPVYIKTIRKTGFGAWNLGTVPILEIYDVKLVDKNKN